MPQLLWDASALVKRYYRENGADTVKALFALSSSLSMTTYMNYSEVAAILRRKYNGSLLASAEFHDARALLYDEVFDLSSFRLLSVTDSDILAGVWITDNHNLNSTDAAILAAYLEYAAGLPSGSPTCVLIASDLRLLRASAAEGLQTLNPELLAAADVPAFLASFP